MATYTAELHELTDQYGNDWLFDFNYPIFDENYRSTLEQNIFDYFAFREVCILPPEKWKHLFKTWFRLYMPYYNQRYRSALYNIDPLVTDKLTTSHTRNKSTTNDTDYGSILSKYEQDSARKSGLITDKITGDLSDATTDNITQTIKGEADATSNEILDKKVTGDKASNLDSEVTKEQSGNESTNTDSKRDVYDLTNETSSSDVITSATTDGTTNTTTTGSKSSYKDDYPQWNLNNPPPSTGGYLSASDRETTQANSDTTVHEETKGTSVTDSAKLTDKTITDDTKTIGAKDTTLDEQTQTNTMTTEDTTEQTNQTVDKTDIKTTKEDLLNDAIGALNREYSEDKENRMFEHSNSNKDGKSTLYTKEGKIKKEDDTSTVTEQGHRGISESKLIQEWRDSFILVDMEIIKELSKYFMGVW